MTEVTLSGVSGPAAYGAGLVVLLLSVVAGLLLVLVVRQGRD